MIRQSPAPWGGRDLRKLQKLAEIQSHIRACVQSKQFWSRSKHRTNQEAPPSSHDKLDGGLSARTLGRLSRGRTVDRDFFLSVLSATSTKREAKSYLSRFKPLKGPLNGSSQPQAKTEEEQGVVEAPISHIPGVNLGTFYSASRNIGGTPPIFRQGVSRLLTPRSDDALHVALVKIRSPETLTDDTLHGVARTLSQLRRLGLSSIIVVDCYSPQNGDISGSARKEWQNFARNQSDRLVSAIDSLPGRGGRRLDGCVGISRGESHQDAKPRLRPDVGITFQKQLLATLSRGVIPIIPPIAYTSESLKAVPIRADDLILTLACDLSGHSETKIQLPESMQEEPQPSQESNPLFIDRVILLDPLGGIPSLDRSQDAHVFINLEQEFQSIKSELVNLSDGSTTSEWLQNRRAAVEKIAAEVHLHNLELLQRTLEVLPPSSSALLTTPEEAANSGQPSSAPFQASGVGTRRQRNALIHNLLTDKPVFSSSLPPGRLGLQRSAESSPDAMYVQRPTTFVKRGMPITILPKPGFPGHWEPPMPGERKMTLQDPRIDLPRLIHLIEDSFDRKLDVHHYLDRVNNRLAGIIIAGDYEGGALFTWELPTNVVDDGSADARARMVPYLDKFAVLKRSQGAGGVADIVFKAMVTEGFPHGVCWRSRGNNPVNKWYFERAKGTWKMSGTNWTMFWTTEDISTNEQLFLDYESVCRAVVPSWADQNCEID